MSDFELAKELIARFITDKHIKTKSGRQIKMISEGKRFDINRMWSDEEMNNICSNNFELLSMYRWLYAYCRDNQEKFGA